MTNQEAFYIIGNIPIPIDDENYDICQYQEAKAIALDCIDKVDKINEVLMELEELRMKEYDDSDEEPYYSDSEEAFDDGVSQGKYIAYYRAIEIIKDKLGVNK